MTVPIVGKSTVPKERALEFLLSRNPNAPREVVDIYYELEDIWGFKADLLLSQNFHETDYLRSWWSAPPRRNPAGIGVTGHKQKENPNSNAFAFNDSEGVWAQGYSFADWRASAMAHFAHMCAYVYADERNNASQHSPRYKIARAWLTQKNIPLAVLITDLNGKWAVPGTTYGQMIIKMLNAMANRPENAARTTASVDISKVPAPNIIDLTGKLSPNNYSPGRGGIGVKCVILHDTAGTSANPDTNSGNLNFAAREQGTANYLLTGGASSIHYMVGPEQTGAKIYKLCPEEHTAWHAAGVPTRNVFVAPDGTRLEGRLEGVSKLNRASIGIERWGIPNETVGPNQTQAMISLVVDLARRHNLKPEQIITHKFVQTDRSDGEILLDECRAAVAALYAPAPAPAQSGQASAPAAPPVNEPLPIMVNPPIVISQSFGTVKVEAAPAAPEENVPGLTSDHHEIPDALLEAPLEGVELSNPGKTDVEGYTATTGSATVNIDDLGVHTEPNNASPQLRDIDTGGVVLIQAFTDNGEGGRWYLIDAADGGGWISGASLTVSQ
jgi:hypothetical protein